MVRIFKDDIQRCICKKNIKTEFDIYKLRDNNQYEKYKIQGDNMNKGIILVIILAMTVFLSGCGEQQTVGNTFIGGTEGLKASFLTGTPPDKTTDGGSSGFSIVVKLENVGESSVAASDGYVQIWGLDAKTYNSNIPDFKKRFNQQDNFGTEIRGSRMNAGTPLTGGVATIDFGELKYLPVTQGDLPQTVWANICYKYTTKVAAQICVKNNVEQALNGKNICEVEGEKNPQNSGAPIQVTSLKETYAGNGKIGLTLIISHAGNGDNFFKDDNLDCRDVESNVDAGKVRVKFSDVQVSGKSVPVLCQGMDSNGYVRLFKEASSGTATYTLYCTVDVSGSNNVVEVPVGLELSYVYLQHITSPMTIRHITQ
jgi:hypothetical protein